MTNTTKNRIALFVLFCIFEGLLIIFEQAKPTLHLDLFTWALLAVAASFGGPAIAYLAIGEWIRWPLTKVVPHSSGAGESTEPRHEGFLRAPGILFSCPLCSGTWVGLILIGLFVIYEPLGRYVTYVLSIGGALAFIVRAREGIEAATNVLNELNGKLHRENAQAQGLHQYAFKELDYVAMEQRFMTAYGGPGNGAHKEVGAMKEMTPN